MNQIAILAPLLSTFAVVLMILRNRIEYLKRQAVRVRSRDQLTSKIPGKVRNRSLRASIK